MLRVSPVMKERKKRMKDRQTPGFLYVFFSAVLFSIGGICIKMVPWNAMSINSARNLISAIMIGIYLRATGHRIVVNPAVLFGALCTTATTTLYVLANKMTTAANTIVLQFTAPVFVVLFSWLFFRKKPRKLDVITIVFVLIGIIFFFVDGLSTGNTLGNVLALISGVSYAGVFMMNSFAHSDSLSSIFIGQCISAAAGFPFLLRETDFGVQAVLGILLLGIFQVGLAYILLSKGLKTTSAVTASLTSAIEPILNPMLVAIFWHEYVTPTALVGAGIVIVSIIVYNVLKAKQQGNR